MYTPQKIILKGAAVSSSLNLTELQLFYRDVTSTYRHMTDWILPLVLTNQQQELPYQSLAV